MKLTELNAAYLNKKCGHEGLRNWSIPGQWINCIPWLRWTLSPVIYHMQRNPKICTRVCSVLFHCLAFMWFVHPYFQGCFIMTSSNRIIFRVTGPLFEEFTGHQWIPLTRATDAEFCCFLWSTPEQTVCSVQFSCFLDTGCTNNRDAGGLRRHRADYDVIVMFTGSWEICKIEFLSVN